MSDTLQNVLVCIAGVGLVTAWVTAVVGSTREPGRRPGQQTGRQPGRRSGPCPGRRPGRRSGWFCAALATAVVAQTAGLVAAGVGRGTVAVFDQAGFLFTMSWVMVLLLAWFVRRGAPWVLFTAALPVALVFLGASVLAPPGSGEVGPTALAGGWLLLHIATSIVAYAAFSVSFAAASVTLVRHYSGRSLPPVAGVGSDTERIGYQAAVFGFPFMTMMLFSGALWARYVWGRYWAWDPIESWGLVTWLVYAAYLHAQYSRRWGSIGTAWLAVAGFACVVATYLFFTHL